MSIDGYPDYAVLDDGSIAGPSGLLKPAANARGYMNVCLSRTEDGRRKRKTHTVHRLVATALVPNPNGYKEVNHKDGDKSNNHPSNLEWISRTGNLLHATAHGLFPTGPDHYKWKGGVQKFSEREAQRVATRNQYSGEAQ